MGEIGHMNVYRNGRHYKCGSSGFLGRYVSALEMIGAAFYAKCRYENFRLIKHKNFIYYKSY